MPADLACDLPHNHWANQRAGEWNVGANAVKNGVRDLLGRNLSSRVDEVFYQSYDYFALSRIRLNPSAVLEVTYRPRPHWLGPHATDPRLHVVARAQDGKLYHARKTAGGWGGYTTVPFPSGWPQSGISQDPALFHSGGDQLELAAVNGNNALVYGHWRDEAWAIHFVHTWPMDVSVCRLPRETCSRRFRSGTGGDRC